jgi:acetyl-CoA decarbonylase/synthase, CODH/ACS complex subunit delta
MAVELLIEKWQGKVAQVAIGATAKDGGTRSHSVIAGGETGLPFLAESSPMPNKPVVAFEIWDIAPADWPDELAAMYKKVWNDPFAWAQSCVAEHRAQLLCVRLQGSHPDFGNRTAAQQQKFIADLLKKVDVPLIIIGSGDDETDNLILPACCEAAKGEKCLVGCAVQDNYKTLAAGAFADGHSIIAESPIDINIAKQLNILISDMGIPLDRLVINPTIGALGYGLEYAYSIMERARLSALSGDKMVAMPFICFVGQEASRAKESRVTRQEFPQWGPEKDRACMWEALTAASLIQAGADILVMRHPVAALQIKKYIEEMTA